MLSAHIQAWCWQDEWCGLTIENIRQLELETQLALQEKYGAVSGNVLIGNDKNGLKSDIKVRFLHV